MHRAVAVGLLVCFAGCRPAELGADAVKAKSRAFLDADDRADEGSIAPVLGASFVHFEDQRFDDRARFLAGLHARAARHAEATTRTWREENVALGDGTATFLGDAVEHFPARADEPARDLEFWNSIVWVRERAEWKVAFWQVDRVPSGREAWNEAFRAGAIFQKAPNQLLVDTVTGRTPGTALDLAMGQGRNAIWLASQGWKVTGIDFSDEGIRIAKETAAKRSLALDTVLADMDTWDLGTERWDLVTMIYAGADPKLAERARQSLRRGGLFVVEVFHAEATGGTLSSGFAKGQLAAMFHDGFTILRDEVVQAHADWGPPNDVALVRFVARRD